MTGAPTRLLVIRHAQPGGAAGRCYGSLDLPLSPAGRRQAAALSGSLADAGIAALYTSPRERAAATAAAIAARCRLPVTTHHGLQELDFGELEGRSFDEIRRAMPELYERWMRAPTTVSFPGGESFADLYRRATTATAEIRRAHGGGTVALVTHGGVCRALVAQALDLRHDRVFRLEFGPARVTVIDWHDQVPLVRLLNGAGADLP